MTIQENRFTLKPVTRLAAIPRLIVTYYYKCGNAILKQSSIEMVFLLYLDYTSNNLEAHDLPAISMQEGLKAIDRPSRGIHPYGSVPIQVVAHQCCTCRFGKDPKSSVLDLNCRTHDLDNNYKVYVQN
ncbi:hypothetical protein IQ238_05510 [Pleurocapsales cyanobacterium LEGE 06147]|nr:hypothetical protein [Pleurocapsales cyanobacterium LEGE 06147]